MRSLIRVVLSVVLGALALTACGSHASTSGDNPISGGVLREGLVQLGSSDPAKAQTVSERQMADQLYDGLTAWSPTALNATPSLASSWQATPDLKQWTFHLNPNAKASNGEPVTASDVKLSLEHIARKSSGSVSTDLLSDVTGFADFTNGPASADLHGIVVVDPATVQINLDAPFADLPLLLGNPTFGIVHYSSGTATYTTGPYMISQTPDSTHVVLAKSPGSSAYVNTIDVNYFSDVDTSYAAFQTNHVDWTPVSPDKAAAASKAYGSQLFRTSLRTLYLSFNLANPALANAQFRQALIQAINRIAVVNDIDSSATRLDGVVPNQVPGHQGSSCGAPCSYDVGHAKTLLATAFPQGGIPPLPITVSQGAPFTDAALREVTSDLAAVGVTATVNRLSTDQFNQFTVNPDREVFQTSWSAAYPSAGAFLQPLFESNSPSNVTGLKDQKTDADIVSAQNTQDDSARLTDFSNVERDVLNLEPIIPIATFPVDSVEQSSVRGIDPLPTGNFDAARAWVTKPQP